MVEARPARRSSPAGHSKESVGLAPRARWSRDPEQAREAIGTHERRPAGAKSSRAAPGKTAVAPEAEARATTDARVMVRRTGSPVSQVTSVGPSQRRHVSSGWPPSSLFTAQAGGRGHEAPSNSVHLTGEDRVGQLGALRAGDDHEEKSLVGPALPYRKLAAARHGRQQKNRRAPATSVASPSLRRTSSPSRRWERRDASPPRIRLRRGNVDRASSASRTVSASTLSALALDFAAQDGWEDADLRIAVKYKAMLGSL
jgi:hypothetical protein